MKNKKVARWFTWIKATTTLAVFAYLVIKLRGQEDEFRELLPVIIDRLSWQHISLLLLLMPLNWFLETSKWKLLVSSHTTLSWKEATQGVLTGLAMGFVTPHAVGDYFGRLISVKNGDSWVLGGMVLYSRSAQMLATLCFGSWGLASYYQLSLYQVLGGCISIAIGVYIVFRLLNLSYANEKLSKFLWVFRNVSVINLLSILFISFLRYAVFAFQLGFAIHVIASVPWIDAFSGTTWILLIKSIAPAFNFLSDLGVREVSAIIYFEHLQYDILPVIGASLLIWIINILLPTICGLYTLWRK